MRFLLLLAFLLAAPCLAQITPGQPPAVVSPDLLASLPHWLQVVLAVLGAVVPTFSIIASVLNRYVRAEQAAGRPVSSWLLALGGGVNVVALNPDKAAQQLRAIDAPQVPAVPTMTQAQLFAAIASSTGVPHPLDPNSPAAEAKP